MNSEYTTAELETSTANLKHEHPFSFKERVLLSLTTKKMKKEKQY